MNEIYYRAFVVPSYNKYEDSIMYEEVPIYKRTNKGVWYFSHYDIKNKKNIHKFICESRKLYDWKYDQLEHIRLDKFEEVPTKMRYAWPTKKEALISLKFKNKRYIEILDEKLVRADHDRVTINKAIYDMDNPRLIEDKSKFNLEDA